MSQSLYEQDMQDQAKAIHEWKVNKAVQLPRPTANALEVGACKSSN